MADSDYWSWYQSAFGAPSVQGPAPGPAPMTPEQIAEFYRSVGISSPVGKPPTTRTLPSIPMPAPERSEVIATYSTKPQTTGNSFAGLERYTPKLPPIPGPNGYINTAKTDERLMPGEPGITAPLTPQMLVALGLDPATQVADATGRVAPVPFPPIWRQAASPPLPIPRPERSATQPVTPPLRVVVSGANPIPVPMPRNMRPMPVRAPSALPPPIVRNPVAAARLAVSQSGDTSAGNQLEAAQLIASGNAWRAAQERKK